MHSAGGVEGECESGVEVQVQVEAEADADVDADAASEGKTESLAMGRRQAARSWLS